jgi:precorrin-6B methylase 2
VLTALRATRAELARAIGIHPDRAAEFFKTVLALDLLERDCDGGDQVHGNSPTTAMLVDDNSPRYVGAVLEMFGKRLFKFWHAPPEALRTGSRQNEITDASQDTSAARQAGDTDVAQLLAGISAMTQFDFRALAAQFDFSPYHTLCDVGGADATLSIELARRHEHLSFTSFDLPAVEPVARRKIAAHDLAGRIAARAGDFLAEELPAADVITMSRVLHDLGLERKQQLIRNAYEALPAGGVLIVIESFTDGAPRDAVGSLVSLNMVVDEIGRLGNWSFTTQAAPTDGLTSLAGATREGFDYTEADLRGWCSDAGFHRFDTLALGGPASALIAYK